MVEIDTQPQVLVVGLGPVGATVANLLGRQGIRTLVIDRATEIYAAPRAISLDNEALRILQMCGLEEGELDTVAIPHVRMHSPYFGQFAVANTHGVCDGHPKLVTFFQPQLEKILRTRLNAHACVQVLVGTELLDLSQDECGVCARIRVNGETHAIRSKFVVGADGANSSVRQLLGKRFDGQTYPEDWLVVDAKRVPKPIDHVEFLCSHKRPVPHMVAPGDRQRWEFKLRRGETREQMERPETIQALLAPWGRSEDIEIERVAVYRFHARIADSFAEGRVFLAGDAAHITPPFVGQGLVAGLRDAGNLCWKLAWVLRERGGEHILRTYNQERRPHVVNMVRLATFMGRLVMPNTAWAAWLSHGIMALARRLPRIGRMLEELEIKPAHRFSQGLIVKGGRSLMVRGALFAQGWVRKDLGSQPVLSDTMIADHMTLVGFGVDPTRHLRADLLSRWRASGGRCVQVDPRGPLATPSNCERWEDVSGDLLPRYAPMHWIAVVRPDRAVMHDGPPDQVSRLVQEALDLISPATGSVSVPLSRNKEGRMT